MSGPRIEVQLAPPGWTHIGGPQLHALIARAEDDELLVAASDAADTGSLAAVVAVLTGGGELPESGGLGAASAVPDGAGEATASFVVLAWGESTRIVVRGQGYAVAQVGEGLVRFASAAETLVVGLGPEAEQVNLCAPDERSAERFAGAVEFDPGRYAELAAAAAAAAPGGVGVRPAAATAPGVGAVGSASGGAPGSAPGSARVAPRASVPSVIATPPVWGRAPSTPAPPAPVPADSRTAPSQPGPNRGFDLSRLGGWDRLSTPAPAPLVPAPTEPKAPMEPTEPSAPTEPTPQPVAVPEHTLLERPAPDPAPGPVASYDFLLQPDRRPGPPSAAGPVQPSSEPDAAGVASHPVPAAPDHAPAVRAESAPAAPAPASASPPVPTQPPAQPPSPPTAEPARPAGPRISSVPWRRREPQAPTPSGQRTPPAPTPAPTSAAPSAAPAPATAPSVWPAPATAGVRTPPPYAAMWGAAAAAPAPVAAPPPAHNPTSPPTPAPPAPEPVPLVDRFLGSPTRPHTPEPRPAAPPAARPTTSTTSTASTTSVTPTQAVDAAPDPDPDATIERSQLAGVIGGPSVLAVLCPQGHVGPPHLASCRRCGLEIPPQEPYHTARPALGVLKLSTGDLVTLDRGVLLGRSPRPSDTTPPMLRPHVLKVPSPERDISRNHAEIVLEGWHVLIRDLDSTNGTTITLPGGQPTRLRPNDQQVVEPGTIITLADEVDIVYEVEP